MKKYIATLGAEVIGSAMNNWFVSENRDVFFPIVQKILDLYGIDMLQDDQWYLHQISLDIFKLINAQNADFHNNLTELGIAYVETARFPYQINNTRSALMALPTIYHLNIRNIPQTEGYQVSQLTNGHLQIKDLNPFPHDTVYGFIWGITKRFRASKDVVPYIKCTFLNPDDPDSDGAIYDVELD